jgi:hypothetical protein
MRIKMVPISNQVLGLSPDIEKLIDTTKVCGHVLVDHLIPKYHSTRCWNIAAWTCFNSDTRALVRSGTDVGLLGLAHSWRSNSSQRCSMGLRSGLCAGQSSSSYRSQQIISVWTSISARGHCHGERGLGLPQTVGTKVEAQTRLECHCML